MKHNEHAVRAQGHLEEIDLIILDADPNAYVHGGESAKEAVLTRKALVAQTHALLGLLDLLADRLPERVPVA